MANKKVPTRLCVGCKEMKLKKDMIRVLKNPEGEICLDFTGKQNGRGAYLCRNESCLAQAFKTKSLERSLKVSIPSEIVEALTEEMKNAK